ncbi:MAG: exodeoxyribonuclease VII large subunit [Gemmatimonadetes bacterium]|nr:exodeoxyribonuclease VII large subunit [Gemmatimonadota bacterium]
MADDLSLDLFPGDGESTDSPPDEASAGSVAPSARVPELKVWSVSQVNRAVRALLESAVDALWVGGEVANWTRARSGHCYFTLKDEKAQLRCVMWRTDAERLPTDPDEGMQVRVFGSLTLYEARGEYQMSAQRLEAEGAEGLWRLAFEKLRRKLEEEGLLDPARKRALPRFPATVGVVTSLSGAALHDILTVLRRRAPWIRVVVHGARVQGEGADLEIARAVDGLGASRLCDVIIVGRGGGSLEDLWAFNLEAVARAIAACPVPVVSAVGHEVDTTISDLVADLRAPTPSAAAEAVAPDAAALRALMKGVPERLGRALRGTVSRRRQGLAEDLARLRRVMERRLAPARQTVDIGVQRLEKAVAQVMERRRGDLAALAGRLQALSPLGILERGYSVAQDSGGGVLRRVEDFPAGRTFVLRVSDGSVSAESRGGVRRRASEEET